MATDTISDAAGAEQLAHDKQMIARGRAARSVPLRSGVLAVVVLAGVVAAVVKISSVTSSEGDSPRMTYTIARGDLVVTVTSQGLVESSENTEIKCQVRGRNAVLWIVESGTTVKPGDSLVRIDSLFLQEQIDERTKYAHWSQSAADQSTANIARATLAVSEYEQGRYISEVMSQEKDLVVAEAALKTAENRLSHTRVMARSKYISELDVEEKTFAVQQAKLNVELNRTQLDVLKRFTKKEQSQTLSGELKAITATHKANAERATADASRRDRALDEVQHCVVKAPRGGLVIHPSAANWESGPIAEGTRVYKDQIMLLMPDLSKMQVKVGINESVVDRVKVGQKASVKLADMTLEGTVSSVASITKPAGWWTANEVNYDTMISLPAGHGLRPGMSAETEVTIASYEDVLTIPVAAVVESGDSHFCWVQTAQGPMRRPLKIGDSNGVFIVVDQGLAEGDEVILNPIAFGEPELADSAPAEESESGKAPAESNVKK
jgi:multidrug efflux pump subunit AcrA (membrane-fusion protein)